MQNWQVNTFLFIFHNQIKINAFNIDYIHKCWKRARNSIKFYINCHCLIQKNLLHKNNIKLQAMYAFQKTTDIT